MAETSAIDNDIVTSFSNPNYTMSAADALNSNLPGTGVTAPCDNAPYTSPAGVEAYDPRRPSPPGGSGGSGGSSPGEQVEAVTGKKSGFLGYYANLEMSAEARREREEAEGKTAGTGTAAGNGADRNSGSFEEKLCHINSPDSNDSGIQADVRHVHGPLNDDLYAVPEKLRQAGRAASPRDESAADAEVLPPGWEKHEDEGGAYYWHIKSGTIQREVPPPAPSSDTEEGQRSSVSSIESSLVTPSTGEPVFTPEAPTSAKSTSPEREEADDEEPVRFAVRSLGWVRIAEEDLTPERSSRAVNRCIVDLSLGRNDLNDVVGRWGDGKDLFMDLDQQHLVLIDPQDMTVLTVQPIQSIRVWGVGRDNGRDFAFVARDRVTRRHMCHVFRCDMPARHIANTLRDICKRILVDHTLAQEGATGGGGGGGGRPRNLPNLSRFSDVTATGGGGGDGGANGQHVPFESLYKNTSFPTPMEEPKKVLRCHYLGTAQVPRASGVEVANAAMEKVYARVPPEKWVFVSVAVAPSTVTISEHGKPENVLVECRVRYLPFMAISMNNVKLYCFILHTAEDQFVAHVFHCEPTAGALCKTIMAACKLRYQKCLDANPNGIHDTESGETAQHMTRSISSTLKAGVQNVLGKFMKKTS